MISSGSEASSEGYFDRPLAPAPVGVLVAVTGFAVAGLVVTSNSISNDWLSAFAGVGVMTIAWAALDVSGRARSARIEHPLITAGRLPTQKSFFRTGLIALTLIVLVGAVGATAEPGKPSSPLPYLLAALFVALVLPQIVARRSMRDYDRRA